MAKPLRALPPDSFESPESRALRAEIARLERELRGSKDLFRVTFDLAPIGKALVSVPDGRFLRVNAKFCEMLRYSAEELLSMSYVKVTHPDDLEMGREVSRKLSGDSPVQTFEKRYVRKDGEVIWASVSSAQVRDESDRITSLVSSVQDITGRKIEEARTRDLLHKYQKLVDTIDGIVWEATPEFRFTFVSKKAERILGYPTEQWKEDPDFWVKHLHPEDRDSTIAFCKAQAARLQDHDFEYRMIAADGRAVWVRDLVHVIVENGRLAGLRGIMVDATSHKLTSLELRDSYSMLYATLESTADGILVVDLTGKITRFNQNLLKLWRIPERLLANRSAAGALSSVLGQLKDPERFQANVKELFSHPEAESYDVLEFKDGRTFERYSRPQRLEERIVGRVWSFRDITDQKRYSRSRERLLAQEILARKEAERAVQLRDDFLSIATHELRTPLTPIRMNLQLIRSHVDRLPADFPKIEFLRRAVHGMDHEFERFLKLVENLLDVSRISAGRLVVNRREFDLADLVKAVIQRFRGEIWKSKCEVRFESRGDTVGRWDLDRIEQVVINILTNALKYGAGKPIEVTVAKVDGAVVVEVKDHGIGIAKEDQCKVFHRFERLSPLKHFGGFGLGLFISQEIVEAHGGKITLESNIGRGSTFRVELPLVG